MKRPRGRGRRQPNSLNRSYDSNGPDVRVRGTATQVYEKYQVLARDAQLSGDRVGSENYLQHAEHYYRILLASQPARPVESAADNEAVSDDDEMEANGVAVDAETGEPENEKANGEEAGNYEPLILSRDKPAKSKSAKSDGRKASDAASGNGSDEAASADDKQDRGSRRRGPLRRRRTSDKVTPDIVSAESTADGVGEAVSD